MIARTDITCGKAGARIKGIDGVDERTKIEQAAKMDIAKLLQGDCLIG
jgi:hypothetical protein